MQLKKTRRPAELTITRKAEVVLQDAEAYQRADVHEAIRQGLEDVAHGRTRPAREAFNEIRRQHGIRR